MSIVALKRNSRRFLAPISGYGNVGFSLNGGHRNIGAVGQTNLAKSVTRTRFRGALPMGTGGCCGQYKVSIHNSGSCCTNDSSIVKNSVKNNRGHIWSSFYYPTSVTKTECLTGPCPTVWVKNYSPLSSSQAIHIMDIVNQVGACAKTSQPGYVPDAGHEKNCESTQSSTTANDSIQCQANGYHIGGKYYTNVPYGKNLGLNNSQSEYMRTNLMQQNCLPTPPKKQSFPPVLNHTPSVCSVNALTPAQAMAEGLLPQDWQG
jgi:hypothetical protein